MWRTGQVTHYNVTIWASNPLQCTILKNPRIFFIWAGNPLQCDHPEKFSYFFNHRAGRLEQLDHSRNSSRFFYHRAGCPKQFDPFQITKKKWKWDVFQMTCSLCKSHMSIYCFWSFQDSFPYLLFFINLLHKAKENEIFQCLRIVNIIKRGQLS